MNKTDIKRVIAKLEPDKGLEYRLQEKIKLKHNKKSFSNLVLIAVGFVVVIFIGIPGYIFMNKQPSIPNGTVGLENGIYIPKIELPKNNTNIEMDMIGLIVYQGRIYTQSDTRVSFEDAEKLIEEKLGITKSSINEWSNQNDYDVEFASNIGIQDVYSVKGYDKEFRIMTYLKEYGTAEFFDCLNGITVKTGSDVFDKLKLKNNIQQARYENFDSWNNGEQQYKDVLELHQLEIFINELENTTPYEWGSREYLFENGNGNQKFLYIYLNDGVEVQLRLFKEGYVYYRNSAILFKMESDAFTLLWNELK